MLLGLAWQKHLKAQNNVPEKGKIMGETIVSRIKIFFLLLFCTVSFSPPVCSEPTAIQDFSLIEYTEKLFKKHPGKSGALVLERGEISLFTRSLLTDFATKSIDVQYFIWSTDNIGILAAESLLKAAERGTHVRVIVDDFLIDAPAESMIALAAHPNIDIKIYNPTNSVGVNLPKRVFGLISNFTSFNQRMHDKVLIVDDRVAVTGGRNMADEYYDYDHEYNFRDRDILVLGPVVTEMKQSFERFWKNELSIPVDALLKGQKNKLTNKRISEIYSELHRYALNPENYEPIVRKQLNEMAGNIPQFVDQLVWDEIVFVSDEPGKNSAGGLHGGGRSTDILVKAIQNAKKSVLIQSPYLIFPDDGIEFFKKLVKKGVEVSIVTNSLASTDNMQAFSGYLKQRSEILKAGIKVYEFRPDPAIQRELIDRHKRLKDTTIFAIHAKTMVVDGELLFVGTFNLDPRSTNLNTEVGVLIRNEVIANEVEETIKRDMLPENSWDATVENPDTHASIWKQLKAYTWALFPLDSIL